MGGQEGWALTEKCRKEKTDRHRQVRESEFVLTHHGGEEVKRKRRERENRVGGGPVRRERCSKAAIGSVRVTDFFGSF